MAEFIWTALLFLAVTPFYIHGLGTSLYGVWIWILAVTGFVSLFLDPGFSSAGIKYLADLDPMNDRERISNVVAAMLIANLVLGLLGGLVIILFADSLTTWLLHVPAETHGAASASLRIAAALPTVAFFNTVYGGVLRAFQRLDILSILLGVANAVTLLGGLGLVSLGWGLQSVILWQVLTSIGLGIAQVISGTLIGSSVAPWRARLKPAVFKEVFSYGRTFFVMSTCGGIAFHFPVLVVGSLAGTSALSYFSPPYTVASRMQGLVAKTMQVVFPLSSNLRNDIMALRRLYLLASRMAQLMALSIGVPLLVSADKVVAIWLGPEFAAASIVLGVLLAAFLILSFAVVSHYVLNGIGLGRVNLLFTIVTMLIVVAVSPPLIASYGAVGAAFAVLVGYLAMSPSVYYTEIRILRFHWLPLIRELYAPGIVPAASVGVLLLTLGSQLPTGRFAVVTSVLISSCAIAGLSLSWSFFRRNDPLYPLLRTPTKVSLQPQNPRSG